MNDAETNQTLLIVIVNYRTADLTIDCLRSLEAEVAGLPGARVVVADNASADGSVEKIDEAIVRHGWSRWSTLLRLDHNGGFAYGNNAVIRQAMQGTHPPDYFMLLNPDTVVRPGAVQVLWRFMEERPEVGVVGSLLESPEGYEQGSAHRFPHRVAELNHGRLGPVERLLRGQNCGALDLRQPTRHDWVSGASMMIRRRVIDDIGLFDEGYFLYFEEVDFCYRASKAGWQAWLVPASRVMHLEGAATQIRAPRKRRSSYWYDSRRRFFVKAYGVSGLILADAMWLLGRGGLALRRVLRRGGHKGGEPLWFARDLLLGDLSALVRGRVRRINRA